MAIESKTQRDTDADAAPHLKRVSRWRAVGIAFSSNRRSERIDPIRPDRGRATLSSIRSLTARTAKLAFSEVWQSSDGKAYVATLALSGPGSKQTAPLRLYWDLLNLLHTNPTHLAERAVIASAAADNRINGVRLVHSLYVPRKYRGSSTGMELAGEIGRSLAAAHIVGLGHTHGNNREKLTSTYERYGFGGQFTTVRRGKAPGNFRDVIEHWPNFEASRETGGEPADAFALADTVVPPGPSGRDSLETDEIGAETARAASARQSAGREFPTPQL